MATPNRSAQFNKLQKVLKKHYDPVLPLADRTVLEHVLFAVCLENSHYDKAEEVFARLQFYDDWNEIRVTSATELGEVMAPLGDPAGAAAGVKGVLQGIYEQGLFDQKYNFDIEHLRKQNIGKAAKELEKFSSVTPFVLAYVTHAALGGHAIPLDKGTLDALLVLDMVSEKDHEKHTVPGLERAIPKNKGPEFSSLLHQLGADFYHTPHSTRVRNILLEINPGAKERLPKRGKDDGQAGADAAAPKRKKKSASRPAKAASKSAPKKKTKASSSGKSSNGLTKRKPR
ncbi:MAG: hypothetical protein KY475_24225 [Planctomycetes bacterium]|nr:hypothetical protein [Planctomycetota bacterium]